MKNILFGLNAIILTTFISGCVNPGPAPQNVKLKSPDGRAVIIKDIYELPLIENKKLKETEIVKIFFPKADNVRMKCSMTLIKIPSGVQPPKYKQTSSQIIYAISGGGKLQIGSNIIVLKKGIMVYVPPNATMSITNNVNAVLELVIVTSPPFETSQMTVLEKKAQKVTVAKDGENNMNSDDDDKYQAISEKYRTKKRNSSRKLSVDEYKKSMDKFLSSDSMDNDSIADLLKDDIEEKTKPAKASDSWPLKMPDSDKEPLKKLENEQEEKLIPNTPQKAENTSLKNVQELTPKEHKSPLSTDEEKSKSIKEKSSESDQDSLEKLLNDQKKKIRKKTTQEKLIPKEALKAKKTSLKHVQELSPEENVPTKSDNKTTL